MTVGIVAWRGDWRGFAMAERERIRDEVLDALKPYGVRRIALFGSTARGDDTPDSDIDVLVLFEEPRRKPLSLLTWVRLERELGERLGRRVELVSEKALSRHMRPHVEKDLVVLFEGNSGGDDDG